MIQSPKLGRPRKDKPIAPVRVEKKSEEYYLDRALQTPGLLNGTDYMKAVARLCELRGADTKDKIVERKNERLARFLGHKNTQANDTSEQDGTTQANTVHDSAATRNDTELAQ